MFLSLWRGPLRRQLRRPLIAGVILLTLLTAYGPERAYSQADSRSTDLREPTLLSESENAYNPIPSPDGKLIAYVKTGFERPGGSGGFGRSNLESWIKLMDSDGHILTAEPLVDAFLQGWTPDGRNLMCFRDWNACLISLNGTKQHDIRLEPNGPTKTERAAYLPQLDAIVWGFSSGNTLTIQTSKGELLRQTRDSDLGANLAPSPNGRYLANVGRNLRIYDTQTKSWSDLGSVTIGPDNGAVNSSWSPWFSNSEQLTFISENKVMVSSPDGTLRQTIAAPAERVGYPAASPNGQWVAFVSFSPRPRRLRPDLTFWGNSTIWVAAVASEPPVARQLTATAAESTSGLRWLNNDEIVFDRLSDSFLGISGRLWKVRR